MNDTEHMGDGASSSRNADGTTGGGGSSAGRYQIWLITGVALALYATVRLLPVGSNVNHMDFRLEGKGTIE
ncbi:MAG TPA: hypothetical protein VHN79_09440, partial [Lacunisphaera sp.]|nr:hypothetical protein [Lacunisphaera sp.]